MATPKEVVDRQAKDDGLWFRAQYASEAYLQAALRELHAAVEADRNRWRGLCRKMLSVESHHEWCGYCGEHECEECEHCDAPAIREEAEAALAEEGK